MWLGGGNGEKGKEGESDENEALHGGLSESSRMGGQAEDKTGAE
jgi:hypothetical protein